MFDRLLSIIAPHYCYNCHQAGAILCQNCKNYIINKSYQQCVWCDKKLRKSSNLCKNHRLPIDDLWCFTERDGALARIIDDYKFHNLVAGAEVLSEFLQAKLTNLPENTVLVPIPTVNKNIRRRGYDHANEIAKRLAKSRKLDRQRLLRRQNNIIQHYAKSSIQRRQQAKTFFKIRGKIDRDKHYLIVDDIFTTGATVIAAAKCLRQAGANHVSVAVLARHKRRFKPKNDDNANS